MKNKTPPLILAVAPMLVLTTLLFINYQYFNDALGGANQTALIIAAMICGVIGFLYGTTWHDFREKITHTIHTTLEPILILFLIGALSGSWMISGVIPMMIYYGVEIMHPSFLLVAAVLICSLVSVATGSSWTTVATVGIAIIGVGNAFGLNQGLVAGAVISGAYFGDKMSPLSDTTNLASAVAGTDLFTHIKYMVYTTGPAWILTVIIFLIIGIFQSGDSAVTGTDSIKEAIAEHFNTTPLLMLIPVLLIIIIVRKTPAIPAMLAGILLGVVSALVFQRDLLDEMIHSGEFENYYQIILQSIFGEMSISTSVSAVDKLLSSGGMTGMLNTVFLILSALVFGGTMEASGCLKRITDAMIAGVKNRVSLVGFTLLSGVMFNITTCDQYLSIVIPGKMLQKLYKEKGYKPEVLSRALEDSATVTSPLVPWNSCGATQSKVLGVSTFTYLPFCFFNFLSPIVNLVITVFNYKIKRLDK
ncbi:MAG: Na+/H+ antiporter NhaC [Dysgonamonadaceae bacterium]|jgi:NhaC family Na+:H+ antiporter|nr:Na+/H+ antiporter NhaC [Dysgonamonadaceae bacterium]